MKRDCDHCGKPIEAGANYYDSEFDLHYCSEECYETHLRHIGRGEK